MQGRQGLAPNPQSGQDAASPWAMRPLCIPRYVVVLWIIVCLVCSCVSCFYWLLLFVVYLCLLLLFVCCSYHDLGFEALDSRPNLTHQGLNPEDVGIPSVMNFHIENSSML